jgi:adenylate cyclase class 2
VIEAELKARVRDPTDLHSRLRGFARAEHSTYHDTYYDRPDRDLTSTGRELRLRTVQASGQRYSLVTYKKPAVDAASGSKPEYETRIEDPSAIDAMLRGLDLGPIVAFEKRCTNYRFTAEGRDMLATVVTVPELEGTFLELETMTGEDGTTAALADIQAVLTRLGITSDDLTTELYTDAVMRQRLG